MITTKCNYFTTEKKLSAKGLVEYLTHSTWLTITGIKDMMFFGPALMMTVMISMMRMSMGYSMGMTVVSKEVSVFI